MQLTSRWMSFLLCVGVCSCGSEQGPIQDSGTKALKLTKLFTNVDVSRLQATAKGYFEKVSRSGLQANSTPGTPGGSMTMTPPGRKLQRFQLAGKITDQEIDKLLSKLKSELSLLVTANGAKIVGKIEDVIQNRPIAYLIVTLPGATRTKGLHLDLLFLRGFYLEYSDAKGTGRIDVMAAPTEPGDDAKNWYMGLVIHEAAEAQ